MTITISNLTKSFDGKHTTATVLNDVSFSVEAGEIFAVVGPSGAGKSTLARCLNLLERPTSGEVIVNGDNLTRLSSVELRQARRRIGTVFQSSSLLSRRTAASNVALPLEYLGATPAATKTRVAELLDRVGLSDKADHYPHQLSGGQRQRVGIARALALKPSVLLSDEATSGLDAVATGRYLQLLAELRTELDLAVVFITHEMETVVKVADRVGRLDHGTLVEQGGIVEVSLDARSPLGAQLRSPAHPTAAADHTEATTVTYGSPAIPADWLTRLAVELSAPLSILGANVQSVNGVTVGDVTVGVPVGRRVEFEPGGDQARPGHPLGARAGRVGGVGVSTSTTLAVSVPTSQIPDLLVPALIDTVTMVVIVMALVFAVGLPLGAVIHNVAPGGLFERRAVHLPLSWIISVGRSLPFLVLMTAIIPFTRLLTGTNIGIAAAVVPMSIAGIAFFTRIVENSLRSVPDEVIDVARASGGSPYQVITAAQIPEALPNIIGGLTINTIAMIEYSTIAGTIGAGGLGYIAVTYGYQRFDHGVMLATIVVLVAIVALIQIGGDVLVRRLDPTRSVVAPR